MNLKERMDKLRDAGSTPPSANTPAKKSARTSLPMYQPNGRTIKETSKKSHKKTLIILSIATLLVAMAGIVYIPQFFVSDEILNEYLLSPDKDAVSERSAYLEKNGTLDFDIDGSSNANELSEGTNPYSNDSDGDGIVDGIDRNPLSKDDDLYNAKLSSGIGLKEAYEMDGVILWATDDESLAHGSVVKTKIGYQFTNFKGWAKFPDGEYAYLYKDGIHKILNKRDNENAWKIPGSCTVVLTDERMSETNELSFFGNKCHISNVFGGILSAVLPSKGWITCSRMLSDDVGAADKAVIELDVIDIQYDENNYARYAENTNSLSAIAEIYASLDNKKAVLASMFNEKDGEAILEIYGYTESGNLLVANPNSKGDTGVLVITPSSKYIKNVDGDIVVHQYFDFWGCGFDSERGDTISFFATAIDEQEGNNNGQYEPGDVIPENGTLQVDGETHYYIDKLVVTDTFIRFYNGKYEVCEPLANGAFYVGEDKTIQKGLVDVDGATYVYGDGKFLRDQFVSLNEDGTYSAADNTDAETTICVNANGLLIKGWFTYDGIAYYADPETGILHKDEIAKYTDETKRYLNTEGKCATSCYIKELDENKWEICELTDDSAVWVAENGVPITGWYKLNDVAYYADPETGIVQKNIVATYVDSTKRYLGDTGTIVTSCYVKELDEGKWESCKLTDDGAIWLTADGVPATGWYTKDEKDYYGDAAGVVQKNAAVFRNNEKLYLDGNGEWVKECYIRELKDSKWEYCELTDDGAMWLTAEGIPATGWYKLGSKSYYANSAGVIQKSTIVKYTDGTKRYLSSNGLWVSSCYVKELGDGKWQTCSVTSSDAIRIGSNAAPVKGWFTISGINFYASTETSVVQKACFIKGEDGKMRYLIESGEMMRYGSVTIDGVTLSFNSKGQCITTGKDAETVIKNHMGKE